jgi:ATP-dependent helicase/DNAse subunit B
MPRAACSVVVLLGPAKSGKTQELVRQYAEALQRSSLAAREESGSQSRPVTLPRNVWLAPNARAAAQVRAQFLDCGIGACLSPGVWTFRDLTRLILADAKVRLRPLCPAMERELLRRVVERALANDELKYFADAARRPAFIDLLADHIHELERSDIATTAYLEIRSPRANIDQHRELAFLYREYQQALTANSLTDEDGSYRAARDVLAAGKATALRQLNLVVADGFTDFTRTQHEMLHLLAARASRLLVSLISDVSAQAASADPRTDLFSKTAATLHQLKHYHPQLALREFPARPIDWPALDHVLRHIFRNPNQVPAPSAEATESLDRFQVVAGASVQDEIVQIARRIKDRLVTAEARPGDIVVVFRSLPDVAPRVREVFDQFGIPYSLASNLPVATAPIVNTLLNLLRLDEENWPFRRLVSIITNNMMAAFDGPARQSAEWLVRELQFADGREQLLTRVERLAANQTPPAQLSETLAQRVSAAQTALPLFQLLAKSLDDLPRAATPNDWCLALARLISQLGISEAMDTAAWRALETHFAALERLDTWLDSPPRQLSRRDVISAVIDLSKHESLSPEHDDVGRVRVVAAPAVRTMSAKHLYLAGMSEQSFPAPERPGQLGADGEYRFLERATDQAWAAIASQGPPPATRSQEEMLLFYEVLSRAEQSLTISYPALDDKAQDLPPSPYVLEIQRVFGGPIPGPLKPAAPQLSPVPSRTGEPSRTSSSSKHSASAPTSSQCRSARGTYSNAEWRLQAVARAIDSEGPDRRPLAGIFASESARRLGRAIDAAMRIIDARAHGESFGPAEGLLTSPAVAARLAGKFGPDHFWSPSQWEAYAVCPYKFFLEDVLKLSPLGELVLKTDSARRGTRMHDVLAAFHRAWPALRGTVPMTADEEQKQFLDHIDRVIEERIVATADGGIDAALLELDRRQIRKWAGQHFEHQATYDAACSKRGVPMKPAHLEFRFGPRRAGDDDSDPESIDTVFELDINGERIRITGKIDRIDVGEVDGKIVFNVIDYKTGKRLPTLDDEHIATGERLQLPLYVEAAQALIFKGNATPHLAGYWSMKKGFDARSALAIGADDAAAERWQKVRGSIAERIGQSVNDIRHGAFPVASRDAECTSYCDFRTVCRIAQVRSL